MSPSPSLDSSSDMKTLEQFVDRVQERAHKSIEKGERNQSKSVDLLIAGGFGVVLGGGCLYLYQQLIKKRKEKKKEEIKNPFPNPYTSVATPSSNLIFPHEHERKMNARIQNKIKKDGNQNKNSKSGGANGQQQQQETKTQTQTQKQTRNEEGKGDLPSSSHEYRLSTDSIGSLLGGALEHEEKQKVTVRVPATSANLGPGYDTLGMAIDMWSEITVERSDKFEIIAMGEGAKDVPKDDTNLIVTGMKAAFKAANKELPICKYTCINRIPYARGLGSSSAAIVAGVMAGLILAGHQLPCWGSEELLQIAAGIEGHPDNVAPAMYGGIQLGIHTGRRWATERVQIPQGLQMVVFIPNEIGKTSTARGLLADDIPRTEAVFNIGRVAWLINALNTGNIDNLQFGVEDMLHQPQRGKHVYKHLYPMIEAAIAAGANGCYLSGAGPSIMAITCGASGDIFTQRDSERVDVKVAQAMNKIAAKMGVQGQTFITEPSERGAHVVSVEPPFSGPLIKFRGEV